MAIPISHDQCWNRLQRLGVEYQALKFERDDLLEANKTLLSALRRFVKACDTAPPLQVMQHISESCEIARSAIAKAEGKTE